MAGLVSYGGDDSSSENDASAGQNGLNASIGTLSVGSRGSTRIIKRSVQHIKATVRARSRTPDTPVRTVTTSQRTSPSASTSRVPEDARTVDDSLDEAAQLRQLVLPRPVPGLLDFGIPSAPEGEPDPALAAKLANFRSLKQSQNRHFNDALMSNRAFRNPHLYATLVEFVDVDERATAFPKDVWDPTDVHADWFSDRLVDRQKVRNDQHEASQAAGKRSSIAFASSSSSRAGGTGSSGAGRSGLGGGAGGNGKEKDRWKPYERDGRGGRK